MAPVHRGLLHFSMESQFAFRGDSPKNVESTTMLNLFYNLQSTIYPKLTNLQYTCKVWLKSTIGPDPFIMFKLSNTQPIQRFIIYLPILKN